MSINLLKHKAPRQTCAYSRPAMRRRKNAEDTPQTSAHSPECSTSRQNLTLSDWMAVYSFVGTHPDMPQAEVVRHFKSLKSSALVFNQPTLSRKIRERSKMEARLNDNPNALRLVKTAKSCYKTGYRACLIADEVCHKTAVANGEVIDVDDNDDGDDNARASISRADLCQRLEVGCMQSGNPQFYHHSFAFFVVAYDKRN
ncbi:hypothetical protein M405DRAFT_899471 [Rhizopogon salebrosus TDB-379]|nr:hypothetical protein M405DRAFT_899471 [Rhizopogon salebrosus TDB-379]